MVFSQLSKLYVDLDSSIQIEGFADLHNRLVLTW
jgi:hypothetical protein